MKILDNLKTLFEGKIKEILSNNKITIVDFSRNTTNLFEVKDEGKLCIDISKAEAEERKLIKTKVIDVEFNNTGSFLNDKSNEKTKQIHRNLPIGADEELLNFYKDKLNPDIYKALEISLTVRNSFKKDEDISELKHDIARKYPTFGNNVCNLTTQGYFNGHFKELYQSMLEDEDFDITTYQKKVEKIIKALPYTVFITRYKSYDDMSGEVIFKLEKLRKYGTGRLLLHGIGKENVTTTLSILDEYKTDSSIQSEIDINNKRTIITATLKF